MEEAHDGSEEAAGWVHEVAQKFMYQGSQIAALEDKAIRADLRLTSLEDSQGKIGMLVTTITQLATDVRNAYGSIDKTAERAVENVLARREVERKEARRQRYSKSARFFYGAWVASAGVIGWAIAHFFS